MFVPMFRQTMPVQPTIYLQNQAPTYTFHPQTTIQPQAFIQPGNYNIAGQECHVVGCTIDPPGVSTYCTVCHPVFK